MLSWLFLFEVLETVMPSADVTGDELCRHFISRGKSPFDTVQVTEAYSSASTDSELNSNGDICGGTRNIYVLFRVCFCRFLLRHLSVKL